MRSPFTIVVTTLAFVLIQGVTVPATAQTDAEIKQGLQDLGGEIKAARLFGLLDDEAAKQMYEQIVEFQYRDLKGEDGKDDGKEMGEDDKRRGGMWY